MFEHLMMKHLFLLFFLVVITAASAIADEPNESRLEAEPFVHPGLLHSRAELDGAVDNRLALGFEYTAKYNLGEDVRYEPFKSFDGRYHYQKLSSDSRGRFSPIY